jgi:hypothetical protein
MRIVRSSPNSWTVRFSALTLADLFLPGNNSLAESGELLRAVDASRLDSVFRIVYHINTLFGRDYDYDPGILTELFKLHIQYVFGEELGVVHVYNVIFLVNHLRMRGRLLPLSDPAKYPPTLQTVRLLFAPMPINDLHWSDLSASLDE